MKELARSQDVLRHARRLVENGELVEQGDLPPELRALSAIIVNMLQRHSHAERQSILRFALSQERFIPVSKISVFSGTSLLPGDGR